MSPPRSIRMSSAPISRIRSGEARRFASFPPRPMVYTGKCSRRISRSPILRPRRWSASSSWSSHAGRYDTVPRCSTVRIPPCAASRGWASVAGRSTTLESGRRRPALVAAEGGALMSRKGVSALMASVRSNRLGGLATRYLLGGVVGGADERAGLHVLEAHLQADASQAHELGRRVVLHERQVLRTRAQVLADGEDVDAGGPEEAHRLEDLVPGLAEAEHDPGLRDHRVETDLRGDRAALGEHGDGSVPAGAAANRPLKAGDRLDVVVEDVGLRLDHGADVDRAAIEVADEDLDAGSRVLEADLANGFGDHPGAAIGEVVARDHRDDDVLQVHELGRLGDASRLVEV